MNYENLDINAIVEEVFAAEDAGKTRRATDSEVAAIRLAALGELRNMQKSIQPQHRLAVHNH